MYTCNLCNEIFGMILHNTHNIIIYNHVYNYIQLCTQISLLYRYIHVCTIMYTSIVAIWFIQSSIVAI